MKAYCPPQDTVTAWHLKDMVNGTKAFLKCDVIKHLYVPHYETLSVEKILTWTSRTHMLLLDRYFPIERELLKFPRQVGYFNSKLTESLTSRFEVLILMDLNDQVRLLFNMRF